MIPSGDTLPSTLHCLCQTPCGISFPRQENTGMEQKLSLLKAAPHSHRNIYPDPYEIIHWNPATSCPKFKHREHNSKVSWCIDVPWNHLEQRSGMENLCLAHGRACELLAVVYCCLSTHTQAYQNIFVGLLQLPCAAFNSSFENLCELSGSSPVLKDGEWWEHSWSRIDRPGCHRARQELGARSAGSAGLLTGLLSPQAYE